MNKMNTRETIFTYKYYLEKRQRYKYTKIRLCGAIF